LTLIFLVIKYFHAVHIADSFVPFTTYSSPFPFTSVSGGRLECTMQNIADNYFSSYSSRCYNDVEGTSCACLSDL